MQSVSPIKSTVDSAGWRQNFVATLGQDVSLGDEFSAVFAKNGTPIDIKIAGDVSTTRSVSWGIEAASFEDYGVQVQVGDEISVTSIFRMIDGAWVEVWTA